MRINKQFIAAQAAKALPSKPGGCCGTAASKQFVFPSDTPEPCCGLISPPFTVTDGIDDQYSGTAQTGYYTIGGGNVPVTCPVTLCFYATASNLENDSRLNLDININGGQQIIPFGTPTCIVVQQGDSIQFTGLAGTPDICNTISIEVQNQTCGGPYLPVGNIYINGDPACTVCPDWDFSNQETTDTQFDFPFQYTGGTGPITIRLYCDNVIANFSTNVIAYVNSTPTVGGTSYDLMQFGGSLGDVDITMNPGDYLIIFMEAPDNNCAETYITFTNVTCSNRFMGQINNIQVNKGAC